MGRKGILVEVKLLDEDLKTWRGETAHYRQGGQQSPDSNAEEVERQ